MGTCSYVLTGTEQGMTETFGTTCHGAVSRKTELSTMSTFTNKMLLDWLNIMLSIFDDISNMFLFCFAGSSPVPS